MNQLNYVSPSQVNCFCECPRKWFAQYILKEIPYRESEPVQLGNIFHKMMELALLAKMAGKSEKFCKPENYIKLMTTPKNQLTPQAALNVPNNNLITEDSRILLPILCESGKRFDWFSHEGENTKLELSINYRIHGVKVLGRIDRVDEYAEHTRIIDLKTGKVYSEEKIANDWQCKLYAFPYLQQNKICNFEFWFVRNNDGKKKVSFHPSDISKIEDDIGIIFEKMKQEDGSCFKTSGLCKFCDYYSECIKNRG